MTHRTIEKIYRQHGIEKPSSKKGRPSNEVPREVTQMVLDLHEKIPVGVTKTYEKYLYDLFIIQGDNPIPESIREMTSYIPENLRTQPPTSYHTFQKIFRDNGLYRYPERHHADVGKTRYEACTSNLIWHVDIHFIKVPNRSRKMPFYAIIDDRSRYLIAYKKLRRKTASECLEVLKEAILMWGKPFCIWSDNGGENAGIFDQYLREHNIKHVHTLPHSPQQNGKMEVWWKTLDRYTENDTSDERIEHCVNMYNDTPHRGLPKLYLNINGKYKHVHTHTMGSTPHQNPTQRYFSHIWKEGEETEWKILNADEVEIISNFQPEAQENKKFEEILDDNIEYNW